MSKSKVVHPRIDNRTLLSTIEFYEKYGGDSRDALSTIVANSLSHLMQQLRDQEVLETYDEIDVTRMLSNILTKDKLTGPALNLEIPPMSSVSVSDDVVEIIKTESNSQAVGDHETQDGLANLLDGAIGSNPREILQNLINSATDAVTQPDVSLDPEIWAPDPNDLPDPSDMMIDVASHPYLKPTELPPDDQFVMDALAMLDLEQQRNRLRAIGIVYHSMREAGDEQFFGTETSMRLIANLTKHVEAYYQTV